MLYSHCFMGKRILVAVINDLSTDQRVHKICLSLQSLGHEPVLVGRKLPSSQAVSRSYSTERMRLLFTKGALFYAFFNFRLFWKFLFKKCDVIYANDLDTLLACFMVSRIRRKSLIYDSHECFTEVPEIQGRFSRKVWLRIEKWIFPKLTHVITVNQSIADFYKERYGKELYIMRNIPLSGQSFERKSRTELNLPMDQKIIILQGSGINVDRGAEELVEAMSELNNVLCLIVGGGDVVDLLKKKVKELKLTDRVVFKPRMPYEDMMAYTACADLGLSMDKDTNLNYRFSLPNKIFDYIKAGIPVFSSNLPELKRVIETYNIGSLFESHDPKKLAESLSEFLNDDEKLQLCKQNTAKAVKALSWENEAEALSKIMKEIG